MTGRLFAGAVVGAIVLFLWGWLWFAAIPFGDAPFSKLPNEAAIVQTMVDAKLEKGTYIYPRMETADAAAMEEWTRQHKQGPLFEVRYHPGGVDPMQAGMMVNGFLHFLLSAIIAATGTGPIARSSSPLSSTTAMKATTSITVDSLMAGARSRAATPGRHRWRAMSPSSGSTWLRSASSQKSAFSSSSFSGFSAARFFACEKSSGR